MSGPEGGHSAPAFRTLIPPAGVPLAYRVEGHGPPLVLVHGSFSDHQSNWDLVTPFLTQRFTVYALARRGRGGSGATRNHSLLGEAHDAGALIEAIGAGVFLLGHSYGTQVALAAAALYRARIRKLVLYEPPEPDSVRPEIVRELEGVARDGGWDLLAGIFFRKVLMVPEAELEELRSSEIWPSIIGDAQASLHDLKALVRYDFAPNRFASLDVPVLLQTGSESPAGMFATETLARVLPDVRIEELKGQGHEAMNTAPEDYARSVIGFLSP